MTGKHARKMDPNEHLAFIIAAGVIFAVMFYAIAAVLPE